MPSSFAFGFCGDDIEADAGDADDDEMELDVVQDDDAVAEHTRKLPGLIPPQKHTLEDIVSGSFALKKKKKRKRTSPSLCTEIWHCEWD